jgi:hypothetical protein
MSREKMLDAGCIPHLLHILLACFAKLSHNIFSAADKTNLEVFKRSKLEGAQKPGSKPAV